MSFVAAIRRAYHRFIPLELRQLLQLSRWTASRRARVHLWRQTDGRVAAGPFAGLRLLAQVPGDCEGPVLLGAFECETHAWLEREFARGWTVAVNIGSAAGFYSTGMAMRLPAATVHAFEMDPVWQEATRRSAEHNGVASRVQVHGTADVPALAAIPIPANEGALVVSDCEGAERELLDPARVPWLAHSALCVELHDFAAPGATDILRARFAATHDLVIVEQVPRDPADWAARAGISVPDAAQLCDEERSWGKDRFRGRWLLATPLSVG
ncbi:MAG: hypothetical protein Q8K55_00760 [Gemmatimonadaceae bacterium]|nr:hypothetical protein [Gemmatimonadaceae bacterium]